MSALTHRVLFENAKDVVQGYGLDLSSYEEVSTRASDIFARSADGNMPWDEPWPPERLGLFKQWMDEGMEP